MLLTFYIIASWFGLNALGLLTYIILVDRKNG